MAITGNLKIWIACHALYSSTFVGYSSSVPCAHLSPVTIETHTTETNINFCGKDAFDKKEVLHITSGDTLSACEKLQQPSVMSEIMFMTILKYLVYSLIGAVCSLIDNLPLD